MLISETWSEMCSLYAPPGDPPWQLPFWPTKITRLLILLATVFHLLQARGGVGEVSTQICLWKENPALYTHLTISQSYCKFCCYRSNVFQLRKEIFTTNFVHNIQDIRMTKQHHLWTKQRLHSTLKLVSTNWQWWTLSIHLKKKYINNVFSIIPLLTDKLTSHQKHAFFIESCWLYYSHKFITI